MCVGSEWGHAASLSLSISATDTVSRHRLGSKFTRTDPLRLKGLCYCVVAHLEGVPSLLEGKLHSIHRTTVPRHLNIIGFDLSCGLCITIAAY